MSLTIQQMVNDTKTRQEVSVKIQRSLETMRLALSDSLPTALEKWPMDVFVGCAILCFLGSTAMHLFWIRSLRTCHLTHNLDLSGISMMIFGSAYGFIYYIFKCDHISYYIYFGIQVFTLLGILVCINCKIFNKEKYQNLKVVLFLIQAGVAASAIIQWRLRK
jgi:predicted membrane channel-forming protein YqfA (hemolysin III family)